MSLLSINLCGDDKLQDLIWGLYILQNGLYVPTTAINSSKESKICIIYIYDIYATLSQGNLNYNLCVLH